MAKKQTRRTISLNATIHELVCAEAAKQGKSASQLVTDLVRPALAAGGHTLPEQSHFTPRREP